MSEIKEKVNKLWDFIETHTTEKDEYPKDLYDSLEDFINLEEELIQTIAEYGNLAIKYLELEKEKKELEVKLDRCLGMGRRSQPLEYLRGKLCWYLKDDILKLLRPEFKMVENYIERLEKALDKACERLEESCPVDQELVEDLDCDNCNDNCKKCWKKYFMKEVLGNE